MTRGTAACGIAALACLLANGSARAGGFATPTPPPVAFTQRLGVQLPPDMPLQDADGRSVRLGDFLAAGRPVLLVPGYYRCPNLCGTLMHGVLEAAADTGLPRSAYVVVGFSIDPADTPVDAAGRQADDRVYAAAYGSRANTAGTLPPVDLHLLVGTAGATAALARDIGYGYRRMDAAEPAEGAYAHGTGFVVATPQGTVSRYFMGVRFEPKDLRLALVEASGGRVGTLTDRIALLCAHFDPATGRYSGVVMNGLRLLGIAGALGLAAWILRHRRTRAAREGTA